MRRRGLVFVICVLGVACGGKKTEKAAAGGDGGGGGGSGAGAGPAAGGPPAVVSADDCDEALANLKAILPAGTVTGDDEDKKDCLGYPKEIVLCWQKAKTEPEAEECVAKGTAGMKISEEEAEAVAPEPRATTEDCRKAVEQVRALNPGIEGSVDDMVRDCTSSATPDEAKCLMAAKTQVDLDKCEPDVD
jgi:hypothetical protein